MCALLKADWYRARKSGIAALVISATAICALLFVLGAGTGQERYISSAVPVLFIFFAAYASAILCGVTEERDAAEGAMRNKVVSGYTRPQTYWSMYVVNTLITYACAAAFLAVIAAASLVTPLRDYDELQLRIMYGLAVLPSFVALYSLIGVIRMGRGTGIACFVAVVVLTMVSMWIFVRYMDNGPAAAVLGFFNSFLPTGQAIQLVVRLCSPYLPLYSLGFCAVCWTLSVVIMKRRNLQ